MTALEIVIEKNLKPKLIKILKGDLTSELHSSFLKLNNRSDMQLLNSMKVIIKIIKLVFR
jgi:hypothetical protein